MFDLFLAATTESKKEKSILNTTRVLRVNFNCNSELVLVVESRKRE